MPSQPQTGAHTSAQASGGSVHAPSPSQTPDSMAQYSSSPQSALLVQLTGTHS